MSLEENPSHPSVYAEIEKPSDKAELRIFLVDPEGRRPPKLWISDQGRTVEYHETIAARTFRMLRRR
jgi:hypothetical protein